MSISAYPCPALKLFYLCVWERVFGKHFCHRCWELLLRLCERPWQENVFQVYSSPLPQEAFLFASQSSRMCQGRGGFHIPKAWRMWVIIKGFGVLCKASFYGKRQSSLPTVRLGSVWAKSIPLPSECSLSIVENCPISCSADEYFMEGNTFWGATDPSYSVVVGLVLSGYSEESHEDVYLVLALTIKTHSI